MLRDRSGDGPPARRRGSDRATRGRLGDLRLAAQIRRDLGRSRRRPPGTATSWRRAASTNSGRAAACARIAAERASQLGLLATSATTAWTNSPTSPGAQRTARSSATVAPRRRFVGGQRRRQHLADLLEIARHDAAAERHVLEELGRRSEELAVDHVRAVRRHVDVARLEQPRALRPAARGPRRHDAATRARASATARSTRCLKLPSPISRNFARGAFSADPRNRLAQHVDAVPAAERAGETDRRGPTARSPARA